MRDVIAMRIARSGLGLRLHGTERTLDGRL